MRKWQRRARVANTTDRNLTSALMTITKLSGDLRLPSNVLETASMVYRQMLQLNLIRGRTIHSVGSASVYLACRKCGIARSLDEVAAASGIARKDLGRAYRFLRRQLSDTVPLMTSEHYVSRFMNHLDLEGDAETLALKLIRAARQAQLTVGKAPISIAAAAIYIAALVIGKRRTQRQIAEVTNITEVTVRNRYKDFVEILDIVITL
jgi:transcription initiation factor TFIIB